MTVRAQTTPAAVADGVWRLTLGMPLKINVFFIREDDGVAVFDAGSKPMGPKVRKAADSLGGATRVIVGNAHADHRGGARAIEAPVHCHLDERADMEGDGGEHYFDFSKLPFYARPLTPRLMRSWDDGPLQVAKTLEEGDAVGEGFEVVHLPGHAPGLIALWRESDRLALTSDVFYTLDMWGRDSEPHLPMDGYNLDTEQARASLLRLAAMEPAAAYPGHANPVTDDVRAQLERGAAE